jgi:hypothetical protein
MEVRLDMSENLDLTCAKAAQEVARIAKDDNSKKQLYRLLTQALGVLEEQGVYAFFLFLKTRDSLGDRVVNQLREFLRRTPRQEPLFSGSGDCLGEVQGLAENLDRTLFARDLLRQVLLYAAYHVQT